MKLAKEIGGTTDRVPGRVNIIEDGMNFELDW